MSDNNEPDIWHEHRTMIQHCLNTDNVNESGKRFARGCEKQLEAFGYLSEKQQTVLKLIYSNSVSAI